MDSCEVLVEEMKILHERNVTGTAICEPTDLLYQIPCLSALAHAYHKQGTYSQNLHKKHNWVNYVKAHALYNSCVVRSSGDSNEWRKKVFEVEASYFRCHGLTVAQLDEFRRAEVPSNDVKRLRESLRDQLKNINELTEQMDAEKFVTEKNKKIEIDYCVAVQQLVKHSTSTMLTIIHKLISCAHSVMEQALSSCVYTMVGCGSLARQEMTPYSDLEFFLLHEEGQYGNPSFTHLSVLIYFLISNMGETNLKYMHIEELTPWFEDQAISGFKIDGLAPKAGKIPTGNGCQDSRILIMTPKELANLYHQELCSSGYEADDVIGNISDILASTTVLYEHGDCNNLYEQFINEKQSTDQELVESEEAINHKLEVLRCDINKHDFLELNSLLGKGEERGGMGIHNLKDHLYRFPTILLYDWKIIFHLRSSTTENLIQELIQDGIIQPEAAHHLHLTIAIVIHIRMAAYLSKNSQREEIGLVNTNTTSLDGYVNKSDRFYMPSILYLSMATIIMPLKTYLKQSVDQLTSIEELQELVKNLNINRDDRVHKGLAFHYQGNKGGSYHQLKPLLPDNVLMENIHANITRNYGEYRANQILIAVALNVGALNAYQDGFRVWTFLSNHPDYLVPENPLSIRTCRNAVAIFEYFIGRYDSALKSFNALLAEELQSDSDPNLVTISKYRSNAARVLLIQGESERALEEFQKSIILLESRPKTYYVLDMLASFTYNKGIAQLAVGDTSAAIETHREGLEKWKSLFGLSSVDSHIATSHDGLGRALLAAGDLEEAEEHLRKGMKLRLFNYGKIRKNGAHTAIAFSHESLGMLHLKKNQFAQALEHHEKALWMWEYVLGSEHPLVVRSHIRVAEVLYQKGDLALASERLSNTELLQSVLTPQDRQQLNILYQSLNVCNVTVIK